MSALSYHESVSLLERFGIATPIGKLVKTKKDALSYAERLGYPVVLKISSEKILHNTEVNGVVLNIRNGQALEIAYDAMSRKFHSDIDGFIVQQMHSGHDLLIGMKRDKQFGPVILFGMGGIYVEQFKDVSYRVAPVSPKEALKMISEIRMYPVLMGARNSIRADLKRIAILISRLSILAVKNPGIKEIDLNPVIANEHEAVAVDARMIR